MQDNIKENDQELNNIINNSNDTIISSNSLKKDDILIVNSFQSYESIKSSWNKLYNNLLIQDNFSHHDWVNSNWIWNEKQGIPNIICCYSNKELIAALPLVIKTKNKKNILQFLGNPLNQYNDFLINPSFINEVSDLFFQLLQEWSNHWDVIELNNFTESSLFLKKLWYVDKKEIPFKFKISAQRKSQYASLYTQSNDWLKWLNKQDSNKTNLFGKLSNKYQDVLEAKYMPFSGHEYTDHNLLFHNLLTILDRRTTGISNLKKQNRMNTINSFLKRFCYYNNKHNWIQFFDLLKNNGLIARQFVISNADNIHYLATEKNKGLTRSEKIYLQSLIMQVSLKHKIHEFHFSDNAYSWQKKWLNNTSKTYKIKIYNKLS